MVKEEPMSPRQWRAVATVVAVLGIFVVPTGIAQAAKFRPPDTPFEGIGQEIEEGYSSILTTNEGEGPFVGCKDTIATGETESPASDELQFEPSYSDCVTNIGGSLRSATISAPGTWNFAVETTELPKYRGRLEIEEPVTIKVAGLAVCTITVPAQTISGIEGENVTGGTLLNTGVAEPQYAATGCPGVASGVAEYVGSFFLEGIHVGEAELPNGTTISGFGETEEEGNKVPVIDWEVESPITTKGCEGGEVTVSVEAENVGTHEFEHREASLMETEPERFSGTIPVMKPLHGKATVRIKISGCKEPSLEIEVKFECWIDPSGKVVDGSHEGVPLWDATVTLLSSATKEGTYTAVPSGSEVMSPANRVNPDKSRVNGEFGWDVEEGWYKVEAAKPGCGTASTEALFVPPPQENLEIVLHCEGEQWKLGEEPGEIAQLSVAAPAEQCEGQMRVENVSFGTATIKVLKETGIECTLKKVCEGKALKPGEKCESELEEPGVKPEYELEVEWNGEKFIKRFPA
jgi:hypothetical protein